MIVKEINDIRRINLHLHTRASDGSLTPMQVIKQAKDIGLDLISITDHDTMDAYKQIPEDNAPLRILPGIEISSMHQGNDVHILAYGCDFENKALIELSENYHIGRRDRAIKMIELLGELGMDIQLEEVVAMAGSGELIVRPHIAQVLVQRGYVRSKNEAFEKYIGNFKPAFAPKPDVPVPDVISVIHGAGGFAVIAHPGKLSDPDYIEEFITFGIDGLEVWHPDHYQYQVDEFITIAQNNGLYMTAGSDFHGENKDSLLYDTVPACEIILESVRKLYREYKCRDR
ncbi:MAG: PHP domain-containing protein [Candidatus Cloacimonadaceae bacterium]|jgi:predicted metal-dependent phosphoesterase TrpH|nr:PHP domain-containing protein [Candidatus Cloacimonadota bacterium]MDY0127948.1 PHP domain-containing protein [Candidatus Cloacimonadaceae bacterium]MCB5255150.1 PHP domain-containing protein [Candidatus Cloacimonadota bacterium]MCK9179181.1 PHP domain-containing protein [Candidatus Cloacimonadota bacterium]MCK9242391.1 PHP domain-containing protein [Candidatus Cloacimonadota bacterium]